MKKLLRICGALLICAAVSALAIWLYCSARDFYYHKAYPLEYQTLVEEYSETYQIPESLIYAVIKSESGFRPDAVSSVGARGLMQMTEAAFDWTLYREGKGAAYTFDDLFQPRVSIRYGTYMLSLLWEEFQDTKTVLAAYHAGRGIVNEWLQDPAYSADGSTLSDIPYADTRRYAENTMHTMELYQSIYQIA